MFFVCQMLSWYGMDKIIIIVGILFAIFHLKGYSIHFAMEDTAISKIAYSTRMHTVDKETTSAHATMSTSFVLWNEVHSTASALKLCSGYAIKPNKISNKYAFCTALDGGRWKVWRACCSHSMGRRADFARYIWGNVNRNGVHRVSSSVGFC